MKAITAAAILVIAGGCSTVRGGLDAARIMTNAVIDDVTAMVDGVAAHDRQEQERDEGWLDERRSLKHSIEQGLGDD